MGIRLIGRRITKAQAEWVLANPEDAFDIFWDGDEHVGDGTLLELDKTWACINVLLIGSEAYEPVGVGAALFGGTAVDDDDTESDAYRLRLLSPPEVHEVRRHLDVVTTDQLRGRWDPDRLRDLHVYPTVREWTDRDLRWALNRFEHLQAFYRAADDAEQTVVLWLG